jgi:NADPH-dependent 7-cyano-7-deazaguanine reductase QueF
MCTQETHILELLPCCPVSGNPISGSTIEIRYMPQRLILEVASLRDYIDSYQGGRGEVRSMEGMIQAIAQDAANAIKVQVCINADLQINPNQRMLLDCVAVP